MKQPWRRTLNLQHCQVLSRGKNGSFGSCQFPSGLSLNSRRSRLDYEVQHFEFGLELTSVVEMWMFLLFEGASAHIA